MTLSTSTDKTTDTATQWQAANTARSAIYRWFADVFARELSSATLNDWQDKQAFAGIHEAFVSLDLEPYSARLKKAIDELGQFPEEYRALELAADFAQIFLLSGDDSAPPYASYYLNADRQLYAEPTKQMQDFLASQQLKLHADFREPDDHVSVYFMVMSLWIENSIEQNTDMSKVAQQQSEFLDTALLSWLSKFNARCQNIRVKTDVYPALVVLAEQFVLADREALNF